MTHIRFHSAKAQVIDALRREMQAGLSPATQAGLLDRVETSVASLSGFAATTSNLGSNRASAEHVASPAPANGELGADPKVSIADRLAATLATRPVASLVSTLVLGGVLGALSHAALTSHKLESSKAAKIARPPAAQLLATPTATESPNEVIAITELPTVPSVAHSAKSHVGSAPVPTQTAPAGSVNTLAPVNQAEPSDLAEQLALLETARRAVGQRDAPAALQALAAHAQGFPSSLLTEEREALTIKALVMANRIDEATARARRFEAQFPNSMLLPSIRQTIQTIP